MKIIYISNSILPSRNANSIHVMKMCQAFSDNGHEVVLLAPLYKDKVTDINIFNYYGVARNFKIKFICFLNIPKLWSFSYAVNAYKYIKHSDFNVVYGRDLKSCYLATKISSSNGVMYEPHKPYQKHNIVDKAILRLIIKRDNFKHLVVISDALRNMYLKLSIFNSIKIIVAHDGADKPKNDEVLLSIVENKKVNIGYTGHLYQGRGIDVILEIAKKLQNINFHIVGGNKKDIDYWNKQSSSSNVYFHGFVEPSEVYKYVNSFDIMLAPYQNKVSIAGKDDSSQYMSPLKIFEYMASKKAIIISDLSVLHEVLDDNEALFVIYNNVDEWIETIKKLSDKQYRNKIALNAYNRFLNDYTWKKRARHVVK